MRHYSINNQKCIRALLIFFFIIIGQSEIQAQNTDVIDSLGAELAISKDDIEQAKLYNQLALEYIPIDSLQAVTYAYQAMELAQKSNYYEGVASAWHSIGAALRIRGYNNEAELWYNRLKQYSDSLNLPIQYARAITALGTINSLEGAADEAMDYYTEAQEIYKREDDQEGLAMIFTELGILAKTEGQFDRAIDYYEKALAINLSLNKKLNALKNYNNLANVFVRVGNFAKSAEYYLKSIDMAIDLGDRNSEAVGYSNIGQVYVQQGDFDQALEYYTKAMDISEEVNNNQEIALVKVKIGNVYLYQGKASEALQLFKESAEIADVLSSKRLTANAYNSIGDVYYRTEDHTKAIKYFEMTRKLYLELGDRSQLSHLLIYMGDVFRRAKQFEKARQHLNEGAEIAEEINYAIALRDAKLLLSYVEHDDGNHEASFWAHVEYKEVFDSLRNDEMTRRIATLEAEFAFEQEKDSITFEQDKTNLAYEEKLQRNQVVIQGAISGGILVMVIFVLLYRSNVIKKKSNDELRHKNEIIEIKNNELVAKNGEISELRETEKKLAEETLALKERELTTVTMLSHEKNSLLEQLGDQIGQLSSKVNEDVVPDLKEIKRTIKTNLSQESWSMFMYQFEKVHPEFFKQLKEQYPILTPHDLRLCAYIKVGMDNKEIAQVSNVTIDGVRKSINRLKKKIELAPDSDLRDFLIRL